MSSARAIRTSILLKADVVSDEVGMAALAREWDDLLEQSRQRVYFLRSGWNLLWWRTFRPFGARLFLVTARDEAGRLAGLAPLYLSTLRSAGIPHVRELRFIGTGVYAHTSEFLDVIARPGAESQVAAAVVELLEQSDAWDRLSLRDMPSSSPVLPYLRSRFSAASVSPGCRAHFIGTAGNWESVLGGLSRSTRKNLNYETRRLHQSHTCEFRRVRRPEELEAALDALVRLHQARWHSRGEPGSFAIEGVDSFLRGAARIGLSEDRLRLWTLVVDGEVAAALIGFFEGGVIHYFQAGFDPAYARYSLGRVMLGLCIRDSVNDPAVREFNFMGGEGAYRDHWTHDCRETVTLTLLRPGLRASVYNGFERTGRFCKSVLRTTTPARLRVAGHRLLLRRHLSRG